MLDPKYFQHCVITTSYPADFKIFRFCSIHRKYRKYAPIAKNSDQFILFCWVTWSVSVMGGSFLAPPLPTPDTFASVALSIICLSKSFASVALFNNFATFSLFTLRNYQLRILYQSPVSHLSFASVAIFLNLSPLVIFPSLFNCFSFGASDWRRV